MKKSGLGKGLDSLIPSSTPVTTKTSIKKEEVPKEIKNVLKITEIAPNKEQPRKKFDEDALIELSESIKQFGLLQPILVQKQKDYYEIVAGERRLESN